MTAAQTQQKSSHLDGVDIAKFILSIMIACLHMNPFGQYAYIAHPILRMAVPLFFMISSYFFFQSHARLKNTDERISHLWKYAKRNMLLYFFWFIVLFEPTLWVRRWFDNGLIAGLSNIFDRFLFGSTFLASWYIMAAVIGTAIVVALSRKIKAPILVALFFPIFCLGCLKGNYAYTPFMLHHGDAINILFSGADCSFQTALFWISLGKLLSENKGRVEQVGTPKLCVFLIVGLLALGLEQTFILSHGYAKSDDCYLTLPIACIPALLLIMRIKCSSRFAPFFRAASTITYCMHYSLYVVLAQMLALPISRIPMFLIVLLISWGVTAAVLQLEKRPYLKWLKYSH